MIIVFSGANKKYANIDQLVFDYLICLTCLKSIGSLVSSQLVHLSQVNWFTCLTCLTCLTSLSCLKWIMQIFKNKFLYQTFFENKISNFIPGIFLLNIQFSIYKRIPPPHTYTLRPLSHPQTSLWSTGLPSSPLRLHPSPSTLLPSQASLSYLCSSRVPRTCSGSHP